MRGENRIWPVTSDNLTAVTLAFSVRILGKQISPARTPSGNSVIKSLKFIMSNLYDTMENSQRN